jgi:hypothetical protein
MNARRWWRSRGGGNDGRRCLVVVDGGLLLLQPSHQGHGSEVGSKKAWWMGEFRSNGSPNLLTLVMTTPTSIILLLAGITMDHLSFNVDFRWKPGLSLPDEWRRGLGSAISLETSLSRPFGCFFLLKFILCNPQLLLGCVGRHKMMYVGAAHLHCRCL